MAVEARPARSLRRGRLEQALRNGASLLKTANTAATGVAAVKIPTVALAYALQASWQRGLALARRDKRWRVQVVHEQERRVVSTITCGDRDEAVRVFQQQVADLVEGGATQRRFNAWT